MLRATAHSGKSGSRRAIVFAGAVAAALSIGVAGCGSDDGQESTEGAAIVSIGDSVASGEGNPSRVGRRWEEPRCHRSVLAGQTIAGRTAVQEHPGTVFHSFACSGATITTGLREPYKGIAPNPFRGKLPAQLDELEAVKKASAGGLAAVLLSVGANDVGFSKVVLFCLAVTNCPDRHFNPDHLLHEAGDGRPTLAKWVRDRLRTLPADYARLNQDLLPLLPADRVVIVEYFDPTVGSDGSDCRLKVLGTVTPGESRWARENVLVPLNKRVDDTQAFGWRVVPGVDKAFRGHGVCATERWVRTFPEGRRHGTLHPNQEGHRQIAALIGPVLEDVLDD